MDKEKFTKKTGVHTNSSMRVTGTYPEGMTKKEVESRVKGSFGGRFVVFGQGQYEYIAYTD